MGIKMHRVVAFWTTSTMKDEKSAAKFHYIKTVSGKVVEHSIAFRVVSICWQGDDPFPLKSCLQVTCPLLSMVFYVWEMSELVTQEPIAVESSNFVERLTT